MNADPFPTASPPSPLQILPRILAAIAILVSTAAVARADLASDYAELTAGLGTLSGSGGTPGTVVAHGRASFPLFTVDPTGLDPVVAAGYHNDDTSAARGLAYAHTGWTSTTADMGTALVNAIRWAGRKPAPVIGRGASTASVSYLQGLGFTVKSVSTSMSTAASDLSGVEVFLINFHSGYTPEAIDQVHAHIAAGGAVLCFSTPWALSSTALGQAQDILLHFGLTFSDSYNSAGPFPVPSLPYSPYASALNGLDALNGELAGLTTLSTPDKALAAAAIDHALLARPGLPALIGGVQTLSTAHGWMNITLGFDTTENPVQTMLVRYQSEQLSTMPPSQFPPQMLPSAASWPGLPSADGPIVNLTLLINGNSPPPDPALINQGNHGSRIPLGLYAAPGAVIEVTIPPELIGEGLQTQVGVHVDRNFNKTTWNRYPEIVRYDDLTNAVTRAGSAFGGLIFLRIPPGKALGAFYITIKGAIEAPHFVDGTDTTEDWNSRLKHHPGAWGYISTSNMTVFASRTHLLNVNSPEAIAAHWGLAIALADSHLGYLQRFREESALTDRQILVGFGHAGYPVMMEYGDSADLLTGILPDGDWGFYHELGHTYQDNGHGWNGTGGGEVDVNLVPHLLMTLIHKRSIWDDNTHSTMDATGRLSSRNAFFATPIGDRDWNDISGGDRAAYDFYFNLPESFGFELWQRAFTRFYRWSTNNTSEPAFAGLDRHNRWFAGMCEESGHNLTPYFEAYGWPLEQAVKDRFTALPPWTQNRAPAAISTPGSMTIGEETAPGTLIHTFTTTDPDPGNLFLYRIIAGNEDGAFSLDRWTGELRVNNLDYERHNAYPLTVEVFDNAIPRYFLQTTFQLNISDAVEAPRLVSDLFRALSTASAGAAIGSISTEPPAAHFEILSGNDPGIFSLDPASGTLVLNRPDLLPSVGVITLTIRVRDNEGRTTDGPVNVLVNETAGPLEERWSGLNISGLPAVRQSASFSLQNDGNYIRRLSGYLVAPRDGAYRFWISGNDEASLHLSTGSGPEHKVELATVSETAFQAWDEQPTQQSGRVPLEAGRLYYIEGIQSNAGGSGHLSVAWAGPGITRQPIPSARVIPATGEFIVDRASSNPPIRVALRLGNSRTSEPDSFTAPAFTILNADIAGNPGPLAQVEFFATGQSVGVDSTLPYSVAWEAAGAGTHLLQAIATDSSGATHRSAPRLIPVYSSRTTATLIQPGATWRYFDQGRDLGAAWMELTHDDSAWPAGAARLGFGGDGEATVINGGPANARHPTTYFRRIQPISNIGRFVGFRLSVARDDGAVIYVNGTEVFRTSMPSGTVTYPTLAQNTGDEQAFMSVDLPAAAFAEGPNIVAAEVHQSSGTSSDLGFALVLETDLVARALDVLISDPAPHSVLPRPDHLDIHLQASTPAGTITEITALQNGNPIETIHASQGVLRWNHPPVGVHHLTATARNSGGQIVTSLPFPIEILPNDNPVVTITSPASGESFSPPPSTIVLTAAASDADGIARVELLLDGSPFCTLDREPFIFLYNAPAVGIHTVTALAVDAHGAVSTSAPVQFEIPEPPPTTELTLVAANDTWRFLDNGSNQGTAWRDPGFPDSGWPSGPAKLGFGGDGEVTVVSGNPAITYYFRRSFAVSGDFIPLQLALRVVRDDGVIVHLNGTEIFRDGMPAGAVNHLTPAATTVSGPDETAWLEAMVNPGALQSGLNVIAAEVHQVSSSSSDIGFGLELRSTGLLLPPDPPGQITLQLLGSLAYRLTFPDQPGRTWVVEGSTDLLTWEPDGTNTTTGSTFQFLGPRTGPMRFLRVRYAP